MRFPILWKHHTLHNFLIQNTPHPLTSEYNRLGGESAWQGINLRLGPECTVIGLKEFTGIIDTEGNVSYIMTARRQLGGVS